MHVTCIFTLAAAAVHASTDNVVKAPDQRHRGPILSGDTPFALEDPKELPKGMPAGADTPFELDDKALAAVQQGDESSPFVVEGRKFTPLSAAAIKANDSPFVVEGAPKDDLPKKAGDSKFVADSTARSDASAHFDSSPFVATTDTTAESSFSGSQHTALADDDDHDDKPRALDHPRAREAHERQHFVQNNRPGPHEAQPHTTRLIALPTTDESMTTQAPSTSGHLTFELGAAILQKEEVKSYISIPGTPFEIESSLMLKHNESYPFRPNTFRRVELLRGPRDHERIPKDSALLQTLEKPVNTGAPAASLPAAAPPVAAQAMVLPSMAPYSPSAFPPSAFPMSIAPTVVNPAMGPLLTALPASPFTASYQVMAPLPGGNISTAPAAQQVFAPAPPLPAVATPPASEARPSGMQALASIPSLHPTALAPTLAGVPLAAGSSDTPAVTATTAVAAMAPAAESTPPGQVMQAAAANQAEQAVQAAEAAMVSSKKMMRSEVPPTQGFESETAALGGHPNRVRSTGRLPQGQLSPVEPPAHELFHPPSAEAPLGPITFAAGAPAEASQQAQQLPVLNQPAGMQQGQPAAEAKALSATGSLAPLEVPPAASATAQVSADVAAPAAVTNAAPPIATMADQPASAPVTVDTAAAGIATAAAEPSTSGKSEAKPALLPAPPVGVSGGENATMGAVPAVPDYNATVPLMTGGADVNISRTNSSLTREPAKAVTARGAIISMLLGLFVTLFFLAAVMAMLHLGRKGDAADVPDKEPPRPTRSYRQMFKAQQAEGGQPPASSQPSV